MAELRTVDPNVVADRLRRRLEGEVAAAFEPSASVTFSQATTATTNAVPPAVALGLTTAASSGALIAATTTLEDRVNLLNRLVNQVVDVLQANSMALST